MSFTKQETFDIVARGLLTQAARSTNANGDCKYRGSNGTKCAAGFLIPDEQYRHSLEGETVVGGPAQPVIESQGHDLPLVGALQELHDVGWELYRFSLEGEDYDHNVMRSWPSGFRKIAKDWGLSAAVVDELEDRFLAKVAAEHG